MQPGGVRGAVLPGVGVAFPQGSGLGHGLSVGRAGQHGGPGGAQVHRALRFLPMPDYLILLVLFFRSSIHPNLAPR